MPLKSRQWGLPAVYVWIIFSVLIASVKVTVSSEDSDGTSPIIVNVAVRNDILTWELQSGFTGKVYHYWVLIYKDGQEREDGKSVEIETDHYDLGILNLTPGDYNIEVQAVTPSGPGPYSQPLRYSVEGNNNDSSRLVTIAAVTTTLLIGLILGSALFATMIWRLRWQSQPDILGNETSLPVRDNKLDTRLNVAYSYGHPSLENSTTLLFPGGRREDRMLFHERIYESIESLDDLAASPPFVSDADCIDDIVASPPDADCIVFSPSYVPDVDIDMPELTPSEIEGLTQEGEANGEQFEYLKVLPNDDQPSTTAGTTQILTLDYSTNAEGAQ